MTNQRENGFNFIDKCKEDMLILWKELVNLESGSLNKKGVDSAIDKLKNIFDNEGFETEIVEFENAGNTLVAEIGKKGLKKGICFIGHIDTVFDEGTLKTNPFRIDNGKAYGPGVLDMKGGIVALVYAIKALESIGYKERPIKVIISGDEELGHANSNSGKIMLNESKGYEATFNCETGYADNGIIVGRKGAMGYTLEVEGVAAHSGNDYESGRNAILEMAHKIVDIQKLTDFNEGTTYNVGTIKGGTVSNSIPDYAKVEIDIRFTNNDKLDKIVNQLEEVVSKQYIEGTKTKLTKDSILYPMETTQGVKELFELVKKTAIEIGLKEPYPKTVGGSSDSSYTVMAGVPTVCAMGVQGEFNHTSREYAVVNTLFERTKLLLSCVLNLN